MSTLFVDRRDIHLEHDAGALVIRDRGERLATVPLAPITRVVLRGSVTLAASVLGHLGERGIGVRLKFTRSEARRLSILESEGGVVGDDEVPGA